MKETIDSVPILAQSRNQLPIRSRFVPILGMACCLALRELAAFAQA